MAAIASICLSGLVLGRGPLGAVLHSSNEPGELSQWLCHDDSTINIVLVLLLLLLRCTYIDQNLQLHAIKSFNLHITLLQPNNINVNTSRRRELVDLH